MAEHASAAEGAVSTSGTSEHFESHGHSVAAWILVAFELVGSFVASLGIVLLAWWLVIVGAVLCVAGFVVGRVLQMAGFGVHPPAARAH